MNKPAKHSQGDELRGIQDVARELGVTHRTLRFYEDKGLIAPQRIGKTRVYSKRDLGRMQLILRGKRLGFSLRDISDYLSLYDAHSQTAQVNLLIEMVDQRLTLLEGQMTDLQTTISELREIRKLATERVAQGT